jgi:hypothetical protein
METSSKASGKMIRLMDTAYISTSMAPCTKEIGGTTCSMAKELRLGLITASTLGSTLMARSRAKAVMNGVTAASTTANGSITKSAAMVSIAGQMDVDTSVSWKNNRIS